MLTANHAYFHGIPAKWLVKITLQNWDESVDVENMIVHQQNWWYFFGMVIFFWKLQKHCTRKKTQILVFQRQGSSWYGRTWKILPQSPWVSLRKIRKSWPLANHPIGHGSPSGGHLSRLNHIFWPGFCYQSRAVDNYTTLIPLPNEFAKSPSWWLCKLGIPSMEHKNPQ